MKFVLIVLLTLVCADYAQAGQWGYGADASGSSHGMRAGQERRANRKSRRANRKAVKAAYGSSGATSYTAPSSYGSSGATSYAAPAQVSYGSSGATSYEAPVACPCCTDGWQAPAAGEVAPPATSQQLYTPDCPGGVCNKS